MTTVNLELFSLDEVAAPKQALSQKPNPVVGSSAMMTHYPLAAKRRSAVIGQWLKLCGLPVPEVLPVGAEIRNCYGHRSAIVKKIFGPYRVSDVTYWNVVIDDIRDGFHTLDEICGLRSDGDGSLASVAGDFWYRTDKDPVTVGEFAPGPLLDFPVAAGCRVASIHRGADVHHVDGCRGPWLLLRNADGTSSIESFMHFAPTEREPVNFEVSDEDSVPDDIASDRVATELFSAEMARLWAEIEATLQKPAMTPDDLAAVSEVREKLPALHGENIQWTEGSVTPETIERAIQHRLEFTFSVESVEYRLALEGSCFRIDELRSVTPYGGGGLGFIHGKDTERFSDMAGRLALASERVTQWRTNAAAAAKQPAPVAKEAKKEKARKAQQYAEGFLAVIDTLAQFATGDEVTLLEDARKVAGTKGASLESLHAARATLATLAERVRHAAIGEFEEARDTGAAGDEQGEAMNKALSIAECLCDAESRFEEFASMRSEAKAASFRIEVACFGSTGFASRDDSGSHGMISSTGFHSDCGGSGPLEEKHKRFMAEFEKSRGTDDSDEFSRRWIPERFRKMIEVEKRFILEPNYWRNLESNIAHREFSASRDAALRGSLAALSRGVPTREEAFLFLANGLGSGNRHGCFERTPYLLLCELVANRLWKIVADALAAEVASPLLLITDGHPAFEQHETASIVGMKSWDDYKAAILRQIAILSGPKPRNIYRALQAAVSPDGGLLAGLEDEPDEEENDNDDEDEPDDEDSGDDEDEEEESDDE